MDHTSDAASVLARLRSVAYDLCLPVHSPPAVDGLRLSRDIRGTTIEVPILLIAGPTVRERVLGLDAGADDVMGRPDLTELIARAWAITRRRPSCQRTRCGALEVDPVERVATLGGTPLLLTAREFDIVAHLSLNADLVVTKTELIGAAWASDKDPSFNAVDVQIRRIRRKLGTASRMLQTIPLVGYRLCSER